MISFSFFQVEKIKLQQYRWTLKTLSKLLSLEVPLLTILHLPFHIQICVYFSFVKICHAIHSLRPPKTS